MENTEQLRRIAEAMSQLVLTTRKFKARHDVLECFMMEFIKRPEIGPAARAALDPALRRFQAQTALTDDTRHPDVDAEALELLNELRRACGE